MGRKKLIYCLAPIFIAVCGFLSYRLLLFADSNLLLITNGGHTALLGILRHNLITFFQIPFWDDISGIPYVANPLSSVFYPISTLFVLLFSNSFLAARYIAFFHVLFTGLVMYYACVKLFKLERIPSVIASLSIMLGTHLSWSIVNGLYLYLYAYPWTILAVSCLWIALYDKKLIYAFVSGLSLACLLLAGGSHYFIFASMFQAFLLFYYLITEIIIGRDKIKAERIIKNAIVVAGVNFLCAVGLGAVKLLPSLDYLKYTQRAFAPPMAVSGILTSQISTIKSIITSGYTADLNTFCVWTFAILAGISILSLIIKRNKLAGFFLFSLFLCLWGVLGSNAPIDLFKLFYYIIPGIRSTHDVGRFIYVGFISIAFLIAIGGSFLYSCLKKIRWKILEGIVDFAWLVLIFLISLSLIKSVSPKLAGYTNTLREGAKREIEVSLGDRFRNFLKNEAEDKGGYPAFRLVYGYHPRLRSELLVSDYAYQLAAHLNIGIITQNYYNYLYGEQPLGAYYFPYEQIYYLNSRYKLLGILNTKYTAMPFWLIKGVFNDKRKDLHNLEPVLLDKDSILFSNKAFLPKVFAVREAVLLIGQKEGRIDFLGPQAVMIASQNSFNPKKEVVVKGPSAVLDDYDISFLKNFKKIYTYQHYSLNTAQLLDEYKKYGKVQRLYPPEPISYANFAFDTNQMRLEVEKGLNVYRLNSVDMPSGNYTIRIYPCSKIENSRENIKLSLNINQKEENFESDILELPKIKKEIGISEIPISIVLSTASKNQFIIVFSPAKKELKQFDFKKNGNYNLTFYSANRIEIDAETFYPNTFVIIGEPYLPGWKATIDGKPASIYMANGLVRAVIVKKPGQHKIVMTCYPLSNITGIIISGVGVILFGLALCILRNRSKLANKL